MRDVHSGALRRLRVVCALLAGLALPLISPASAERDAARPVFGPAGGDALHVMSFNLRFASDERPHSWPQRRPIMAELLRRELPTVLGTQEGLYGQLRDVEHDLPAYYDWYGGGRAGGHRDEFTAIFYDTRRVTPLASGEFWLSETPSVPGSRAWGSASIRMATWVRFADRRTGRTFTVFNTHLDDQSAYARLRGAELIRDRIAGLAPVVVTGDFNAPAQHSPPYDVLVRGAGLTDTWLAAADRRTPRYATWTGYRPLEPDGPRIDWILVRGGVSVRAAGINTYARDGSFPSDHLPVQALITLG